jgi:hypothetical protein
LHFPFNPEDVVQVLHLAFTVDMRETATTEEQKIWRRHAPYNGEKEKTAKK